jgi:arginine exporter protein ArgO
MKQAMKITQWVLGISAALSLIVAVIYKIVYVFSQGLLPYTSPTAFLVFTATCSLASIALSLLNIAKHTDKQ